MAKLFVLTVLAAFSSGVSAATCDLTGAGSYVTGGPGAYEAHIVATGGVFHETEYVAAIQRAVDNVPKGGVPGSIGASTIRLKSDMTFEGCATINALLRPGYGAVEAKDVSNLNIPVFTMTGGPYFGFRLSGTRNLFLGNIVMKLNGGIGCRFDRVGDPRVNANYNVTIDSITVDGAGSHAVEVWNIDQLKIGQVIATNCGDAGLLLQKSTNIQVDLVKGTNVAKGDGYAVMRFANENGKLNGQYPLNVRIGKVIAEGGGRGIFCVSESGGFNIGEAQITNTRNNAMLIENCQSSSILKGFVHGGGHVVFSSRAGSNFKPNANLNFVMQVTGTLVEQQNQCGTNVNLNFAPAIVDKKCK